MTRPRIVVCAYSDVGHACLAHLLERNANVVAVYTHADAPGETIWFPSVGQLAHEHGIPVFVDRNLTDAAEVAAFERLQPDLLFSFYFRHMLPSRVLAVPRLGAYNMHGSLLPKYRGRAPVNWAVLHGETETGATLHVMTAKADAGDIVDAERVAIGDDDTAAEVQQRVTGAAVRVLARQLDALEAGTASRRPQDHAAATYFGRRRPEDGAIDWCRSSGEIHNLIRAVSHPYPGAFAPLAGRTTTIWRSRRTSLAAHGAQPGHHECRDGKLVVACGDDRYLEIVSAQRAGEPELTGAELGRRIMTDHHHNSVTTA
ncbi:MAG TPA: formyltransferase [Gemmatimonadaceae bacterium]